MLTFDLVVIDLGFNIVRLIFIADNGSAAHHEGCGQHTTSEQERARDESPELCPTMRTITTLLVVDSNHFAVWASSLSLGSAARRQRATQDVRREDAETTYHRSAADGSVADRSVADRSAADRSVADPQRLPGEGSYDFWLKVNLRHSFCIVLQDFPYWSQKHSSVRPNILRNRPNILRNSSSSSFLFRSC